MLGTGGRERREDDRVPAQLPVAIELPTWQRFQRAYTTNISRGGIGFTSEHRLDVGQPLALTLTLPDGRTVRAQAEIRYVVPAIGARAASTCWIGARFVGIDVESHRILSEAIARLEHGPASLH